MKNNHVYALRSTNQCIIALRKSTTVILFYLLISVTIGLCCGAITDSFELTSRLPNGLSDESIAFNIPVSDNIHDVTIGQLVSGINQMDVQSFAIYKQNTVWWSGVYLKNRSNPLFCNTQTTELDSAYAFVDRSISFNIKVKSGHKYFRLDNKDYQVLYVFENSAPESMQINIDCFTSMDSAEPLTGRFNVDGIELNELKKALDNLLPKEMVASIALFPLKRNLTDRIRLLFRDQLTTMIVLVLTLLLMMISSVTLSLSWIDSKKSELFARFLVGASDRQLKYRLMREFCLLVLTSSILGVIVAVIITKSGLFNQIIRNINLLSSVITVMIIIVIGWLTILRNYKIKQSWR